MPITPSGLKRLRKPLTFDYCGCPVHIEYALGALDGSLVERWNGLIIALNQSEEEAEQRALILQMMEPLCELIAGWDYCEEPAVADGPPGPVVPLTPERLVAEFLALPLFFPPFLQAILQAIVDDVTRGKANGTASSVPSGATSSPRATPTSSRARRSRKASR